MRKRIPPPGPVEPIPRYPGETVNRKSDIVLSAIAIIFTIIFIVSVFYVTFFP